MPAMASKRQGAHDDPDEVEEEAPEEEPEDDGVVEGGESEIDTVPWRETMEANGLIEDTDPGDGLSSPEYVNPR